MSGIEIAMVKFNVQLKSLHNITKKELLLLLVVVAVEPQGGQNIMNLFLTPSRKFLG